VRFIGNNISTKLKQSFIVNNKPGGATVIGVAAGAKAPPDGYTLTAIANGFTVNATLVRPLPYNSTEDFSPVAKLVSTPHVFVVRSTLPVNSFAELLDYAKKNPSKLTYAHFGVGTNSHISMERLKFMAKVDFTAVPYKGQAPATSDLLGGHVDMMAANLPDILPLVESSQLKALGALSPARLKEFPSVPTFEEIGFTGFTSETWFGLLAPAQTPPTIIGKLYTAISELLAEGSIAAQIRARGMEPSVLGPIDFKNFLNEEIKRNAKIIHDIKLPAP
jgi:tripartite-type tricarboxylate transporter receptor subunit TctC